MINQKGAIPLLLLTAAIGIVTVLTVYSMAPFKNQLLSSLFPKPASQAAMSGVCTLTSASWGKPGPLPVNMIVPLKVDTTGDCIGKQVSFEILRENGSAVNNNPAPVNLLVNGAGSSWLSEVQTGGAATQNFYFVSTIVGTSQSVTSPMIAINNFTAPGTAYYIDPAGNNINSGTSQSLAWKDFTNLNSKTLQPGDRVLLKRGASWNQQLTVNGQGTASNFIEIGAYGTGERPKICRNGDIADRTARINNPAFVKISSIEFCNGGAGLVLHYTAINNNSVYLDDLVAHDFFGIYEGSGQWSSNPAWQSYTSPDGVGYSNGIVVTGLTNAPNDPFVLTDFKIANSEVYKTGAGIGLGAHDNFYVRFLNLNFDNLYLHDNDVPDISLLSLGIGYTTDSSVTNTLIVNGTGAAPRGTSAIFLSDVKNLTFDNLTIKDTPLSDSPDNVGVDFECCSNGVSFKNSWFENNAGPAIEFLSNYGMSSNITITDSVFINNDWAKKQPVQAQINVVEWPTFNRPTGIISNNQYTNPTGGEFFGGDGDLTGFTLINNTQLGSSPAPSATPSPLPSYSPTKPGDLDGNNKVDIFDYNILLTNFGKTGTGISGDIDGNNKVDIFDYNILLTNFGK